VDYFSFNESEKGIAVIFSAAATIDFIKVAMKRFKEADLHTKFLLSDAAMPGTSREFATLILADSTIWKSLGPLAFHSWGSERIPDSEFARLAAMGKAINRPVWCTEMGHDGWAHREPAVFKTWDYAFRFAKISQRVMKHAQPEVTMYWTWQNDYPIMSRDVKTYYPSFYATRHFTNYLNTGTQIVHSISSDPEVLTLSGIHENGSRVLQLINLKKTPVKVHIQGLESKSVDMVTTTEANNWEEIKNATSSRKGIIGVVLKPESINSIILN
jgi:O-glycosyl hydrolase